MTGPEHYREAEKLLSRASYMDSRGIPDVGEAARNLTALAQVHATLALTAATALGFEAGAGPSWGFVAGSPHQSGSDGA